MYSQGDDKGRMLHGRLEFFSRNVHKLTKHMTTLVDQHKGQPPFAKSHSKQLDSWSVKDKRAKYSNSMQRICSVVTCPAAGVEAGMKFSERVKDIAAQEPFADLQDRLVALSEITERLALERKSIMCDRAESQVLEKLAEVQSRVINPTKALLRDRDSGIRALVKVIQSETYNIFERLLLFCTYRTALWQSHISTSCTASLSVLWAMAFFCKTFGADV
jgi:hypothetical protein